ncbi:hypothetical protein [Brevibacillus massiliensis]|uniref:hypothetical protein n=1 Tax=Brevibacillus massiliensis TaxID=1118054 RepID=UPI00035D17A4|nr:hypothetical protein [Brevibacillus massiliensis]
MSNVYVVQNGKVEPANGYIAKDALLLFTSKKSIDDFIKQKHDTFKENQAIILKAIEESKQ